MEFHHLKALANQQACGRDALPGAESSLPDTGGTPRPRARGSLSRVLQAGETGAGPELRSLGADAKFCLRGWLMTIL